MKINILFFLKELRHNPQDLESIYMNDIKSIIVEAVVEVKFVVNIVTLI